MGHSTWQQWSEQLAAARRAPPRGSELGQWLQHQRGLHALGWLPPRRRAALEALQVRGVCLEGREGGGTAALRLAEGEREEPGRRGGTAPLGLPPSASRSARRAPHVSHGTVQPDRSPAWPSASLPAGPAGRPGRPHARG